MKDKSIAITGGAGFIGSNLAHELVSGNTITIIDDLSTGRLENIAGLMDRNNIRFIKGSILDLDLLEKAFKGIDFVFHEAAITSVHRSVDDPLSTNDVNITGTLNVLTAARDNKVKKVVFASSSAVYGNSLTLPLREDMTPNPLSPYALSKLAGEYYCRIFHEAYGLPAVSLRYFNVYGPGQNPDSPYAAVVPIFITRVLQGKPPVIYGDGNQTRDFVFVRDVVRANIQAVENEAAGVFNIGRGEGVSVNQLAQVIIKTIGNSIRPVYKDSRPADIRHSMADITKAGSFGYSPEYSLEQGLAVTILDSK